MYWVQPDEPVKREAGERAHDDRRLAILPGQRHREQLVHRDQGRDEDHHPRRFVAVIAEQDEEDRDRDDRDEEPLSEVTECHLSWS